ncbi:NIPSNAP family protein [Actinoplanes awajinensis]|uniref:NIPSNAP family containing protein n=1 Tax=Actinoplanes awajinensis subsp. mycoplanecinus TaxID=135947 RepID=A0A101JQP9_9ACTN|nr:NIPSNAP family protein [Actinoplanes awajinensis]KUL30918.1 NIPSNAP family containing protein [Actinoplanes awajinensis subsp. mycoplanecinus]
MIVELRRYTLRPGRRDELIELFDREFIASQEALGMAVLGQFRDLDRPDMFVWFRGFPDMAARSRGLREFYGGPVWKQHGPAANATMLDSDDVLLLRATVPPPASPRDGDDRREAAVVTATIWYADRPFDEAFAQWFADQDSGAVAVLSTEYAENDFPALPVREGEHAFVWLTRDGREIDVPARFAVTRTERLRLTPTTRSALY